MELNVEPISQKLAAKQYQTFPKSKLGFFHKCLNYSQFLPYYDLIGRKPSIDFLDNHPVL